MTTFQIQEPLEYPRTVRLCTASKQVLKTSPAHAASMLELAQRMLATGDVFEYDDGRSYPLISGTMIVSCDVEKTEERT